MTIKLQTAIVIKPISAKNGIVIKPNQFINSPVQGTRPQAAPAAENAGTFELHSDIKKYKHQYLQLVKNNLRCDNLFATAIPSHKTNGYIKIR